MRVPNPSPVLDKNRAPMGPEDLSSSGAGVWGKAPKAFPDSSSVLDKFRVFSEWGHPNQHRIANVDPSKRNMISHIFFVNEKSSFLLSLIMADHL